MKESQNNNKIKIYPKDFDEINKFNPEYNDNSDLIFDEIIPIEIRVENEENDNKVGIVEKIKINIFKREDYGKTVFYKINLISNSDLFFNYKLEINEENLSQILENNEINMHLDEFGNAILKMLSNLKNNLENYFIVFIMLKDGTGKLEIYQNLEYKYISLLNLDFYCSNEESIRQNISFRYSVLQAKHNYIKNRLKDVTAIIKLKNPNLLLQIQKSFEQSNS